MYETAVQEADVEGVFMRIACLIAMVATLVLAVISPALAHHGDPGVTGIIDHLLIHLFYFWMPLIVLGTVGGLGVRFFLSLKNRR